MCAMLLESAALHFGFSRPLRVSGVPGASVMGDVSILAFAPFVGEWFMRAMVPDGAAC